MKIPKTFLIEKDLENKIGELKSQKKYKVNSWKELILWQDSEDFMKFTQLDDPDFKKELPYLDINSACEKYMAEYDGVILFVLEFVDKSSLKDDKKEVKKCLEYFNSKNMYAKLNAVLKDQYAVLIETFLGDYDNRSKFINAYKKKFGFRELKE